MALTISELTALHALAHASRDLSERIDALISDEQDARTVLSAGSVSAAVSAVKAFLSAAKLNP